MNIDNPILKRQEQIVNVSKMQLKVENSNYLPDLSAGYFNQQIEGVKKLTGFQVGVKVPLFFWSQKGKSQAEKKNSEIALKNYEQTKLNVANLYFSKLQEYKKHKDINFNIVDVDENEELLKNINSFLYGYEVRGFPTIVIYKHGQYLESYSGERSEEAMTSHLNILKK